MSSYDDIAAGWIAERAQVHESFRELILQDEHVIGALLVGSVANGTADEHSDLDYRLYADRYPWTRDEVQEWLGAAALEPSVHYWTGTYKHRLVIAPSTRVDLAILHRDKQSELNDWPHLFFGEKSVIKDGDDVLLNSIRSHVPKGEPNPANDRAAYIINLFGMAKVLAAPELDLSAFTHAQTGLVESRARVIREGLPTGSALWREPSRHAERDLSSDQLEELYKLAFTDSKGAYRELVIGELNKLIGDDSSSPGLRKHAEMLYTQLTKPTVEHKL